MIDVVLGVGIAAAIYFVWSAVSWMALPWQRAQFKQFGNDDQVAAVLDRVAQTSGLYGLPADPSYPPGATKEQRAAIDQAAFDRLSRGPVVFAVVDRSGYPSYARLLALGFVTNVIVFACVAWMLGKTTDLGYAQRVLFVAVFAVAAGVACRVPDWNWHRFPLPYTGVAIANLLVGSILSGFALAHFVRGSAGP